MRMPPNNANNSTTKRYDAKYQYIENNVRNVGSCRSKRGWNKPMREFELVFVDVNIGMLDGQFV